MPSDIHPLACRCTRCRKPHAPAPRLVDPATHKTAFRDLAAFLCAVAIPVALAFLAL